MAAVSCTPNMNIWTEPDKRLQAWHDILRCSLRPFYQALQGTEAETNMAPADESWHFIMK